LVYHFFQLAHARLTLKWFFNNEYGVLFLNTSWVDRSGVEF
jgi:hypothetical protein